MRRLALALMAGLTIAALAASAAVAGGWATTEFDEPLPVFTDGGTWLVGFTVLQHGVTPAAVEGAGLRFTDDEGHVLLFEAVPRGAEGHYVASVARLAAGSWALEVEQGSKIDGRNGAPTSLHFAPFSVGTIQVAHDPTAVIAAEQTTIWPAAAVLVVVAVIIGVVYAFMRRGGGSDATRLEYGATTEEAV